MYPLLRALEITFYVFCALLWASVLFSWFQVSRWGRLGPLVRLVDAVVEPILRPIREALRQLIPRSPIDFSPLVALLILSAFFGFLMRFIYALARR